MGVRIHVLFQDVCGGKVFFLNNPVHIILAAASENDLTPEEMQKRKDILARVSEAARVLG